MSQNYYNPFGNNPQMDYEMEKNQYHDNQLKRMKKEIRRAGNYIGLAVIGYILFQNIAAAALAVFGFTDLYYSNAIFQDCFTILGVSVFSVALPFSLIALLNRKRYTYPVVPAKKLRFSQCCVWVGFGMGCCIAANYFVSFLILIVKNIFGYQLTQTETLEPDSVFACGMCVISTAVVPAICEEFAMRCCSLQLLRKHGKVFGVVAVSIVFGLLHGNVIQFVFATLIGFILGFVTVKTDSIVPAILVHGLNNGMSVTQSIVGYAAGETVSEYVTVLLYLLWAAVGIISVIYLLFKKEFKTDPKTNTGVKLSLGTKLANFFLVPGMLVPFLFLIYATAQTIEKI